MGNMTFRPKDTFYLNNTPINGLVEVETIEDKPSNLEPLKIDLNKKATFFVEVAVVNNDFLKIIGFKWRQRMWFRIKTFLYNITHKRRID